MTNMSLKHTRFVKMNLPAAETEEDASEVRGLSVQIRCRRSCERRNNPEAAPARIPATSPASAPAPDQAATSPEAPPGTQESGNDGTVWNTTNPGEAAGRCITRTVCPVLDGSAVHSRVSRKPAIQEGGGVTIPEVIALIALVRCLSGEDSSTCIIISARDVEIVASHDSSINSKARGSNKVKIQPVAKYDWEHKYYYGNLIAVSNSYLAYAIRGANSIAMIRVLNVGTAERTLLKGFTGGVTDLAFAHLNSNQLACVDEAGNLFVWQLTEENGKIQDEIIVHVTRPESTPLNGNRRIIWCPFIPEENEENAEDGCQTLALLHEDRAEVWDLEIIRSNNSLWPMEATDFKEGFITVKGHNARISEGALSPDGTVLASASHDGCVKFWQIYIEGQDQPRFSPDPFNSSVLPSLKASLDLSAEYLILTDVQRKVLYVMELLQDQEKGRASFIAISEFLLTHPVLSFGIQDVSRSRQRHTEVLPAEEESESVTAGFADQLTDVSMEGLGSDKESGRGSPHDLRRISDLPAPADFLSATSDFKPKLMTPDAFMTPSSSAQQQISASPGSSVSTLTAVTGMSSSSVSDSAMSRTGEEMMKLSLDSSMTLSNSTGMQGSPRNNSILIPGLADQLPSKTVQAEVWDLEIIRSNNSLWPMEATDFKEGFITVKGHNARISEGALSPDGTVLASASHDGCVKFWQIYIEGQDQPRFSPDPFNSSVLPSLKASLDLSAEYLILTDVQRKVLYVMELLQDQEKGRASFTAISEFLLTHPVLSFGIQDVSRSRQRHTEVLPAEEESESVTAGKQAMERYFTRSLQDVQIWFQPHLSSGNSTFFPPSGSHEDFSFADHLTDVSMEGLGSDKESGRGSPHDLRRISDLPAPADFLSATSDFKPKLMTPDAFMTPSASAQQLTPCYDSVLGQQISASPGSSVSTLTAVTGMSSSSVSDSAMSSSMTLSNSTGMQGSPRNNSILIPGLADQLPSKTVQVILPANPPLSLDLQSIEPLLMPQASPTRERSPDVISSASTAMSQDIPEIASDTLQRGLAASGGLPAEVLEPTLHSDSMASAASALHLLSPRNRHNSEHSHHSLDMGSGEAERLSSTPSLLETALSQESAAAAAAADNSGSQPWPAAPDITRETRNSLIDSDHDDEVASLASSSGNYGSKSTHRLPVEWKSSPRGSPKLKRKSKKEEGDVAQARSSDHQGLPLQMNTELQEELLSLVRCQQREISELRQSQLELMKRLTNHMDAVQSSIMGHVERVMITQQEQEQRRMERILADGHDRNRQFQEQLSQQLSQSVSTNLSNRLDKTVRDEMKKTIPQSISKSLEPVTGQLSNTIAAKLTAVEGTLKENIIKMVKSKVSLQDSILTQVQRIVKGEVSMAMKEQQAAVTTSIMQAMRSAAGTPIPSSHLDYQTQQANILQLLQQGQLNQAFQQALSAADLNLVLYVCETVNSQQVFGQNPCPLIQPVLLSLIQQLSTNLATRTELKISYLEDAVMNLDHGDPVTRDHMSSVLSQVRQKLFQFLQADPHNVLSKTWRTQ
ncbi:UNVERIFIED_CONTAM: hypothetical protein FKN15_023355 [Acipenser sinensis]